jgi:uncharacterized membrane protein
MYNVMKVVHILGVVVFVGNIITAAFWKRSADQSGNLTTVAFAQRMVAATDWRFTLPGVILIIVSGYAMALTGRLPLHGLRWLEWGQGLFYISALIWIFVLVPTQRRLVTFSLAAPRTGALDPEFHRLSRRWAMWGGIATLLPIIVLVLMVTKP